jgi:hypothetical protein
MAERFCQPIYEQWLEEAVARGYIAAPGFFADPVVRAAWCRAEWHGPTQGQLDPTKEVEAAEKRVAGGILDPHARDGRAHRRQLGAQPPHPRPRGALRREGASPSTRPRRQPTIRAAVRRTQGGSGMNVFNLTVKRGADGSKHLDMQIHGVIDGGWYDDESVSTSEAIARLNEHVDAKTVNVRINSSAAACSAASRSTTRCRGTPAT